MEIYDLMCRYDARKSFYGKAKIKVTQRKGVIHEELFKNGKMEVKE